VEDSPELLDLLEIATSTARQTAFIKSMLKILPATAATPFTCFDQKEHHELFTLFTGWFGDYHQSETRFSRTYAATQQRLKYIMVLRDNKRHFIRSIGLDWTPAVKADKFSKVIPVCDDFGKFSNVS
jgi:hypothetical protein